MLASKYALPTLKAGSRTRGASGSCYARSKVLSQNQGSSRSLQLPAFVKTIPFVRKMLKRFGNGPQQLKFPTAEQFETMDDESKFMWALRGTSQVSPWDRSETLTKALLTELVAKNYLPAKYSMGATILAGIVRGEKTEAVRLWEECSRAGHSMAKAQLAILLAEGKVVPQDLERAVRLYEEAWYCHPVLTEGHAHMAALNLSTLLKNLGRTKEASAWLLKAADEVHDTLAQYQLAHAYSHGTNGFEVNLEKAKEYNQRAADNGMVLAQHNLGCLYFDSATPDYEAAVHYFTKAHFQEYYWSTLNLAGMYARGQGVPQNFATAHLLLREVATFGTEENKKAAQDVLAQVRKLEAGEKDVVEAPKPL